MWVEETRTSAGPDCPPLDAVLAEVACTADPDAPFSDRTLPAGVDTRARQTAHVALEPYADTLTRHRDALALGVGRLGEEIDRLIKERQDWERRTDPEPPAPYHRTAERNTADGTPFYRVVDFAEHLTSAERAGLEAALEASGILDAWISGGGALLDPLTGDTVLHPDQAPEPLPTAQTLASPLRPVPRPESGITSEQVEHLLSAIALAPASETTAASAVHFDGSWRLGALRGRHHKSVAEYVGAAVRAETRRRVLAELEVRLGRTERRLAEARDELAAADSRRRALMLAEREFPRAQRLSDAWNTYASEEKTSRSLTVKAANAARLAEEARALAVSTRSEADATATAHDLPTDAAALDRVRTALASLLTGVAHLRRAVSGTAARPGGSQADDRRYAQAREKRSEAEEGYRLRLRELHTARQDLRTREAAVGSSEEEILANEQAAKDRIANAVGAIPAAERAHNELRDQRVRAEEKEERLREDLAEQEATVIDTGRALRDALGRPEVVNGAELDRSSLPAHVSDDPGSSVRDRLRALRALAEAVDQFLVGTRDEASDGTLLKRHTALRDQLAGAVAAGLGHTGRGLQHRADVRPPAHGRGLACEVPTGARRPLRRDPSDSPRPARPTASSAYRNRRPHLREPARGGSRSGCGLFQSPGLHLR